MQVYGWRPLKYVYLTRTRTGTDLSLLCGCDFWSVETPKQIWFEFYLLSPVRLGLNYFRKQWQPMMMMTSGDMKQSTRALINLQRDLSNGIGK